MSSKGQTLIEVIVVAMVGILVVTALTFAVIFSLRNAGFAKNQAQATKLAQEGIEKVRGMRDRDSRITTSIDYPLDPSRKINIFSELFSADLSHTQCNTASGDAPCYFRFISGVLSQGAGGNFEPVGVLKRQIQIGDETASKDSQKTVTVIVQWTDSTGDHESILTTILRKL